MAKINQLDPDRLPTHVAIIMDGNGRWAKKQGKERIFGHQQGAYAVQKTVEAAIEFGIKYLTLYAFSTENWNRPKEEVDALMSLLINAINDELDKLVDKNVVLHTIGDKNSLPENVKKEVEKAINATKNNTGLNLIIALSYSSRWEIVNAAKNIAKDVKSGKIQLNDINNSLFSSYLSTANFPDPELMIRTSGELRISNFLLWQISYAELYFTPTLWPDFDRDELYKALVDFQRRERRFGKTSEQIKGK